MNKYSGIAIGGPANKQTISNDEAAIEIYHSPRSAPDERTWYDHHQINGAGVWLVRGAALSDSLKVVLEEYSAAPKDLGDVVKEAHAANMAAGLEPAHSGGEKASGQKYSAVAIGGPSDGRTIEAGAPVVDMLTADGKFTYGWHSVAGVYYWTSPNQHMPLSTIMSMLVERYGKYRDFASGKVQEVVQSMSDRIEELKAMNLKLEERHTEDAEKLQQLREIRIICKNAGFIDAGATTAGLVDKLAAAHIRLRESAREADEEGKLRETDRKNFVARLWGILTNAAVSGDIKPAQVSELEEESLSKVKRLNDRVAMVALERDTANGEIKATLVELRSTGHKHEGRPLSHLVDIAIDTERHRHSESLKKISDALQMTFAIMPNYSDTADAIANVIKVREKIQLPVQLAALERRISTLERRPVPAVISDGGAGGGQFGKR